MRFPFLLEEKRFLTEKSYILVEGVFKGKVLFAISHIQLVQNELAG